METVYTVIENPTFKVLRMVTNRLFLQITFVNF